MSKQQQAKKIRREVAAQKHEIKQVAAEEVLALLYLLPFWMRMKWAWRIARGA